jgi:hypothetical protein
VAPIVKGEIRVTATEASNEVVFESLDGPLSGVSAVNIGRGELIVNGFVVEIFFEQRGTLIVKCLKAGSAAGSDEVVVQFDIG